MAFRFGSAIQKISALAEQFRAEHACEAAVFTHSGKVYTIHVSPYSLSAGRWDIEGFGMFDNQAVFVGFVREFRVSDPCDRVMDFPGWLWKKGCERNQYAWPERGDTLTIGSNQYEIVSTKNSPTWVFQDSDPGRRTILVNARRYRP